jgi:hypothetical protein
MEFQKLGLAMFLKELPLLVFELLILLACMAYPQAYRPS